jgi:hypothetical protein
MKGKSLRLLLVMYPTQQVARKYEEGLTPGKPTGVRFKKRAGPLVAIVDPNASPEVAETLLASIRHEFQVTWNEPRPEPNAAEVILTIFKVTGVALAVTLIAGICFGVVRILVKKWFPGQVFDRPKDMEVIQLKLNQILTGRIRGGTNRLPPSAPQ